MKLGAKKWRSQHSEGNHDNDSAKALFNATKMCTCMVRHGLLFQYFWTFFLFGHLTFRFLSLKNKVNIKLSIRSIKYYIKKGFHLKRIQALYTMHELIITLEGSPIRKHLEIEPDPKITESAKDYVIKIKCNIDENTIKIIEPIIQKRNLKIKKLADTVEIL